jgi:prefoldin subunit 5
LYSKASKLIPNLQVSFEETVRFHNDLLDEKIKYIEDELPSLTEKLKTISKDVSSLRRHEKELSEFVSASEYSDDYDKILIELNSFFERKGNLEERKKFWITSNEKLNRINEELESINSEINSKDSIIQKRITLFNKYFTKFRMPMGLGWPPENSLNISFTFTSSVFKPLTVA